MIVLALRPGFGPKPATRRRALAREAKSFKRRTDSSVGPAFCFQPARLTANADAAATDKRQHVVDEVVVQNVTSSCSSRSPRIGLFSYAFAPL